MKIADCFNIRGRFLRSANLERDFCDPAALQGYVVTRHIQSSLDRISGGLERNSGQRAWRITGDYGSGKSSFALLIAHLFAGRDSDIPPQLRRSIDLTKVKRNKPRYLPVLITGSREPLAVVVIRALGRVLGDLADKRSKLAVVERIRRSLSSTPLELSDSEAVQIVLDANTELIAKQKAEGLLIILDELGKFLEFAALHPERQDVFFLQQLAEVSTRSGKEPLFVVGLLHQGFIAYADQLSQSGQKEWEKIAGRFEELIFDQPLDQVVHLISAALNIPAGPWPRGLDTRAKTAMREAIELGWYGTAPPNASLIKTSVNLYPLHPTVVPILVRLFSRFGQNERSLFSFLLSNEPFGLQTFAQRSANPETFYRIQDLYDYAVSNFGHRLSVQSYRNHWNYIDSLVRSFRSSSDAEIAVLKTVGLLNLINSPELLPSEESIVLAVSAGSAPSISATRMALHRLHKETSILFSRGRVGGYCLWSHTSVNLDAASEEAGRAVGNNRKVAARIKEHLDTRPIVARRHYIQTGNLRHFEVVYCNILDLKSMVEAGLREADGRIVIPLCETPEEVQVATKFARSIQGTPEVLVGLTEPLNNLDKLVHEVERWSWVQKNTPQLKDDRYAAEEVTRQLAAATQTLEKRVQHYAGLRQVSGLGAASMKWFHQGKERHVESGKAFLSLLSDLCDELYPKAPVIHNELVNRRSLSSAGASARMKVIGRMFTHPSQPLLGMDATKKPPEMSIYLSLLRESKLHVERESKWTLEEPCQGHATDPCNLYPGLARIVEILESNPDSRFGVAEVLGQLRGKPFGIREGILPILLTLILIKHHQEIALYEDGTFLSHIGSEEILRLTKAPGNFELQFCKVRGVRLELFDRLFDVLNLQRPSEYKAEILDVVRPLCVSVAELPQYTRTTKQVSVNAQHVRDTILNAREPGTLLFADLPRSLGFEPFAADPSRKLDVAAVHNFVEVLKSALEELRVAYQLLKDRIRQRVLECIQPGSSPTAFQAFRNALAERTGGLVLNVKDMDLKAFCLRAMDSNLSESDWLESIGSLVATTPPSRWKDDDEQNFEVRLREVTQRFLRVESANFSHEGAKLSHSAVRVALTNRDGSERELVVHVSEAESVSANEFAERIRCLLPKNPRLSITAMSRVIWELLDHKNE